MIFFSFLIPSKRKIPENITSKKSILQPKEFIYSFAKYIRKFQSQLRGRNVFARFQRNNGLPTHPY